MVAAETFNWKSRLRFSHPVHAILHSKEDPAEVYLKFDHARIMDSSALEAIEALAGRYRNLGKVLHVRSMSENCDMLLRRKDGNVTLSPLEELETA